MYAVAVTTYLTRNCYLAFTRARTENFRQYTFGEAGFEVYVTGGYVGSH